MYDSKLITNCSDDKINIIELSVNLSKIYDCKTLY